MDKINLEEVKSILIINLGGIGNLLLMIRALRSLRKAMSSRKIILMTGEPKVEEILEGEHLIDEVVLFDRRERQGLFATIKFIQQMRRRKLDLAVVATGTNALKASLMTYLMGIRYRVGEDVGGKGYWYTKKLPFHQETHEMDACNNLVEAVGVKVDDKPKALFLFDEDKEAANEFLYDHGFSSGDLLIGLHVGSGYKQTYKRWPKERFIEVGRALNEQYNAKLLLTGGPQEVDLVGDVHQALPNISINAANKLTLRQTAAAVKRCKLFISNDSGLSHIAAAVQTPVMVLFGRTNDKKYAPQGAKVYLIKKFLDEPVRDKSLNPIELIKPEDVLRLSHHLLEQMGYHCEN